MPQYIENSPVNIGLVDSRTGEVVFRILGTTTKIKLLQPYDGMELIVDNKYLGKVIGPHEVFTPAGKERLKGGCLGQMDLKPKFLRPDVTLEEVDKEYREDYSKILKNIIIRQVQPMYPGFHSPYRMD